MQDLACVLAHGGAGYTPWKGTVLATGLSGGSPNTWAPSRTNAMQKGQGSDLTDCDAEGNLAWTHEVGPHNPGEELGESRCGMAHHAPALPCSQLRKAGGDLGST